MLSDLPAGDYYLKLDQGGETWRYDFEILPGATTYFKFSGISGIHQHAAIYPAPQQFALEKQ